MKTNTLIFFSVIILAVTLVYIGRVHTVSQEIEYDKKVTLTKQCVENAAQRNIKNWNNECNGQGMPSNCRLPIKTATILQQVYEKAVDDCTFIYK